jgi:hypothetical protein
MVVMVVLVAGDSGGGRQRAGNNEVTIAAVGIKNFGGIAITEI